jgi:hypothetical protein
VKALKGRILAGWAQKSPRSLGPSMDVLTLVGADVWVTPNSPKDDPESSKYIYIYI